jgi:hypothetical protein
MESMTLSEMESSKMARRRHSPNAGSNMKPVSPQPEFLTLQLKDIPLLPDGETTLTLLLQESFAFNHTVSPENLSHQLILSFAHNFVPDSTI